MDGAKALAVPTRQGQVLRVSEGIGSEIIWTSHTHEGQKWFEARFDIMGFEVIQTSDDGIANTLRELFRAACQQNSDFLSKWKKYRVNTFLEFDRNWGLGSSSSLVSCIAQWADVCPFRLLFDTLGGSGYDVACAQAEGPILYQLGDESLHIEHVDFHPAFEDNLYLVYLGQKSDSQAARRHYYKYRSQANGAVEHVSQIATNVLNARSLKEFEEVMTEHESIISSALKLPVVKQERFADFWGAVKSLGAWGGDFVLATSDAGKTETIDYFHSKGFETVYPFAEFQLLLVA